jgi:hypothetical protein
MKSLVESAAKKLKIESTANATEDFTAEEKKVCR